MAKFFILYTDSLVEWITRHLYRKQYRVRQICHWIGTNIIGNNPNPAVMDLYAKHIYSMGFQSVQMVKAYLEESHIQSFEWMVGLHKDIFLKRFKDGC